MNAHPPTFRPRFVRAVALLILSDLAAVASPEGLELFESRIRPTLLAECVECHGAEKQKGGLRVDSREPLRTGGDSGPAVVPGKPDESLLLTSIKHSDPDLKMPSKAPKLGDDVIAAFEKWIRLGAPDPRDHPPTSADVAQAAWEQRFAERKQWWAFQPIQPNEPPAVKAPDWSPHPVDRFLLGKMEERGLQPARDADSSTLNRRLHYVLTGLPPEPDAVASTASPNKVPVEATVDRLLASPRFGEHWARHWMDLMRFAESHGSEGDPEIPEAWKYRDYLIRAFNDDVPIDQLIREHIAGDLLPHPRWNPVTHVNESAIGTAHLRLVEHGFQPIDTRDEQIKTLDSQIDVDMKAFQALTVSCARCHDHKFDAISQRDYYALQGVYANCRPAMVTINHPAELTAHRDKLLSLKARLKTALAQSWIEEAERFPSRLSEVQSASTELDRLRQKVTRLEEQVRAVDVAAQRRLAANGGKPAIPVKPLARWSFNGVPHDSIGTLDGELIGGATIRSGRLILDGSGSYLRTLPLQKTLKEKTLEAWVAPANLDQRGGGIIGVEDGRGRVFDTIVFAEKERRRWMAGSDLSMRTQKVEGTDETAQPGELVHLAITWSEDKTIALYRNGIPYGAPYQHTDSKFTEFLAGDGRILLGLRHTSASKSNGCFAGEIEEARVYNRVLSAAEVAASFAAGPDATAIGTEELQRMMTAAELERRRTLEGALKVAKDEAAKFASGTVAAWTKALAAAEKDPSSPLHSWIQFRDASAPAHKWQELTRAHAEKKQAEASSAKSFRFILNPGDKPSASQWFRHGVGLLGGPGPAGDFPVPATGERLLTGLLPAGFQNHALTLKHNGILQSPRFLVETDYISVHAAGTGGAQARLICNGYPLGNNAGLYPRVVLNNEQPEWIKIDVTYRKGTWAYLEFATRDDLTRYYDKRGQEQQAQRPSWFSVDAVAFHNENSTPPEPSAADSLLAIPGIASSKEYAARFAQQTHEAVVRWKEETATEADRTLLDYLVRANLLPTRANQVPASQPLIAQYRETEAKVIEPYRIPGVLEADDLDAPMLPRGDHLKPGELVPRGYLSALGTPVFTRGEEWSRSGRLELAHSITAPNNPLTARVMVNRAWHWIFGRGIVGTPDNFGRMGEKPTHPELLDYLAGRFAAQESKGGFGWSLKQLIRFLVTTRTFALASEPSAKVAEVDPGNECLSHSRVRRLAAESIRDTLLTLAGAREDRMFGPGDSAVARPQDQRRRSVYLTIRRNTLSPFLQVFDSPIPFATTGRRDETNVPAQSLTLLNDPFVIHCAGKWAERAITSQPDPTARVRTMIREALGRDATPSEEQAAAKFLRDLANDRSLDLPQQSNDRDLWRDLAHSLINAKEFIYLR